ncbi:uncharacterized protein LOC132201346 [Neocloeon triangulifer]|uniref:uncharacterized protein LOC132201346 n=1 Tax=Neocloeon triangulifer TaxID=2078957 RepID=UPI00286EC768|nr:uncharacterized protein LOC132201346 [Neocloeon triangulifer]XP_059483433.1 uncharacterized protein LOC132201346 [Neocloeon triangulifer]
MRSLFAATVLAAALVVATPATDPSTEPHSRQKRLLWLTPDGRLALPPGTSLVITPSLSLPFVRYPPEGFFSNMTISLPFTIDFDTLGLTDNANPYGVFPPILARSMGRMAGDAITSYVSSMLESRTKRNAAPSGPAPSAVRSALMGGERALLYKTLEEFLANLGMDGKACVLRAICEVHGHPLDNYGLLGEFLRLFLTASKSPVSGLLSEYVEAEKRGQGDGGECWRYHRDCPKSLFRWKSNYHRLPEEQGEEVESDEVNQVVTLEREAKLM